MGRAWDEADAANVKAAVASVGLPEGAAPVILRCDTSVPVAAQPPAPAYAQELLRRMRAALGKLVRGEKLDGPEEGIVVSVMCLYSLSILFPSLFRVLFMLDAYHV